MRLLPKIIAIGAVGLVVSSALPPTIRALSATSSSPVPMMSRSHRVVIQISENDPATMNTALNNAENLTRFYETKGEPIQIEFVAYGPGLSMVRGDTSPVKERLARMSRSMKNVTFSGCGNTLAKESKRESKKITLLPEAHLVPSGIVRIVQLEEEGWTYVRP